jgi:nitrogen fixation/metabolism regulation signal transduction histidine kinase
MSAFLLWTGFLLLALVGYIILLWRSARKRSRFQARLSILFFLFVLIPTVPLILLASFLFTKSTEVLLLPGIEPALNQSLDVMRLQLNQRGQRFFNQYPDRRDLGDDRLEQEGIAYIGEIAWHRGQAQLGYFHSVNPNLLRTIEDFETLELVRSGDKSGAIIFLGDQQYYEAYTLTGDSSLSFAGFLLPEKIVRTKEDISWALRNYASLKLLRDTVVEKGLVWTFAAIFFIVFAVISVYAARRISRGVSEPIKQLTEGMKKVGSGDLTHRVEVKARDELEFLVNSFNRMTEELKISRENLQRAERAAAWRDIARQISHEIKNPLTPLHFSLFRLKSCLPPEILARADLTDCFRIIEDELFSIKRIADEFSQFARMPHLELQKENIAEIVHQSVRLFDTDENEIKVRFNTEESFDPMLLDRDQFRRAIHNLIKNAIEASGPGDSIEVTLKKIDNRVRIQIIDHGRGMDSETREKATAPYFTTKKDGSGIGLFLVKRIIEDHGGEFDIRSELNKGTCVTIDI